VRQQLINWKFYTTICPPAPSEFLAMAALQAHDKLIARNRTIINDNLQIAEPFFARWPDLFDWKRPFAGSVALVGLNVPSATEYCHTLAKEAGILLLPSSCLGYGDQHIRMGFGRLNFKEGLVAFEKNLTSRQEGL
jgi:aspartate/methionine/tyrosine aminotransferase